MTPQHNTKKLPASKTVTTLFTLRRFSFLLWIAASLFLLAGCAAKAEESTPTLAADEEAPKAGTVAIYLFWGDGCPHCAHAKPYLQSLAEGNSQIVLRMYEIYYSPENISIFEAVTVAAGFEPQYVPTIIIGSRHWEGWNEQIAQEIRMQIGACLAAGCPDAGAGIVSPLPTVTPLPAAALPPVETASPEPSSSLPAAASSSIILPLVGAVDPGSHSLPVSTALIAFVDGFNPCSLWVLSMLLALTLHTGSRRKVLLIGLIFLTVTAAIYALFIAGLFTVFSVLAFTGWIQILVSLVALAFGLINLKDYFWYKQGVSLTISDAEKPGIARRIRALMDPDLSFWSLAGGTVVLAAGVSLVEFSCTAGFPVIWTNLLASQNTGPAAFALLLLLYMVIYQLDELVIFGVAVYSLKASRLEEQHGRILKLAGGMLMLTLALVMLIQPSLMNDLGVSVLIFGLALAAAGIVLFLHRVVFPKIGIHIGSG